jgi:DNA-binding IclR family transcriptional regulator
MSQPGDCAARPQTPATRLFTLLEAIAASDRAATVQSLEGTGLPQWALQRMLQTLEEVGALRREAGGRHYRPGLRLRQLAQNVLVNGSAPNPRHAVLRKLAAQLGASCNLTAFVDAQVMYLERVEAMAPPRFYLHPGSRVPAHCSSSGKLFLAQMGAPQRRRLLAQGPLLRFTGNTITDPAVLERELADSLRRGYTLDNEEYLPGLQCVAVPVQGARGRANLALAVQAPITRLPGGQALRLLAVLRRAASELATLDEEALHA